MKPGRRGAAFSRATGPPERLFNESALLRELREEFKGLEALRKGTVLKVRRRNWKVRGVVVTGAVLFFLVTFWAGFPPQGGLLIGMLPVLLVELRLIDQEGAPDLKYAQEYKNVVGRHVIRGLDLDLDYHPDMGVTEEMFLSAEFYARPDYSNYWSEDCLQGKVGNTQVLMAEIHATAGSENGSIDIFRGWFVVADFPRPFHSTVLVEPDFAERKLGRIGRAFQKLGGTLTQLDNPDFERAFVVRTTDPAEGRDLLTPGMQERMLAFLGLRGRGVRFAFKNSQLLIAIPNRIAGKDWFDPDPRKPASDLLQIRTIARDFVKQTTACLEIVQELNLNTQTGTRD